MARHRTTNLRHFAVITAAVAGVGGAAVSQAAVVDVMIENLSPSDGMFLTPVWIAAHNGGFDSYSGGDPASNFPGLEELAEDGMIDPIAAAFADSAAGQAGGRDAIVAAESVAPPPFNPGESATVQFDVGQATVNRYFSYASMVIPSNDLFIANGDPMAHMLFDENGIFQGPIVIEVFGSDVNDNGTEVNDINGGAAFSANGGDPADEGANIARYFDIDGNGDYLATIVGTDTASGATVGSVFVPDDLVARITITPEPASASLMLIGALATLRRRRHA